METEIKDITINGVTYTPVQLVEAFLELKDSLESAIRENHELRKEIDELETELRVKEDLFKIQSGLKSGAVKIANLPYIEESRPSIEWYEERHKSDCITIDQLNTTIDVLTDKLAKLRGQIGLC